MIYHKINIENVIFFYSKKMSHSKLNRDLHYYKNIGKKFKKRLMSTCKNYIRYYSYIYIINSFCLLVPYFLECFGHIIYSGRKENSKVLEYIWLAWHILFEFFWIWWQPSYFIFLEKVLLKSYNVFQMQLADQMIIMSLPPK